MGVTGGEITFLIFYATFLMLLSVLIGSMEVSDAGVLEGITEEQVKTLGSSSIDPLTFINKLFILTTVSSDFQFLSFILGVLTIPAAFIIIKAILDALPFV